MAFVACGIFAWLFLPRGTSAGEITPPEVLERDFQAIMRPRLERYCFDCHAEGTIEAEIDLSALTTSADAEQQVSIWLKVRRMLDSGQMPPPDAAQPNDQERAELRTWLEQYLARKAATRAGDPGPVVLRRLSNAEYTYTIRDLTEIKTLDPAREFPVDGAAGEGFTNVGSGQGMSPALIQKYLDAAKQVAHHTVLLPTGICFSNATTRRDHTDEWLAKIRTFYGRFTDEGGGSAVDLQGIKFETNQGGLLPVERYLAATLSERDALASGKKTLDQVAREQSLSPKYLTTLWNTLAADSGAPTSPLLDALRTQWRQAAAGDAAVLAARVRSLQQVLWKFNAVGHIGRRDGPTCWMEAVSPTAASLELPELPSESALDDFRSLFPPVLCYMRIVPVDEVVTLTLFYREDDQLKRLILDDRQAEELDRLWDELLYISREPLQMTVALEQISEFATQDRPDLVESFAPLKRPILERADAFRQRLQATEPIHVQSLLQLADRAWRRPLTTAEQSALQRLYHQLRDHEIPHEEAIQLMLVRVLTSPMFLYKLEQSPPGGGSAPVSDWELASRLSYFLWSSLPDEPLRAAAAAGQLTRAPAAEDSGEPVADQTSIAFADSELRRQTRRILQDPRTRRLAIQFACQWLHVRDFDQNDDKNEALYPEFAELRDDMYEETVRFFEDLFRNDRSVLNLFDADYTFLNPTLARHYGIPLPVDSEDWQRVEGVRHYHRGGVLGMATVLASQSGASRTSPILRGNWVYETLLGERLPRPPANVPQLPDAVPSGLTARQLIERHSSDAACAKCHVRIDPFGFALEQYDAIGRLRPDLVDTKTTLFEGPTIDGMSGLRDYLLHDRRDDVVRQFCRKLLGYALGRELHLADEPLLQQLAERLAAHDYRFSAAVETIVTSQQFLQIRRQDEIDPSFEL